MNPAKIKVLCVDDSDDIARLYSRIISDESDMECVGTLASADELIGTVVRLDADVVVLDLTMPGRDPLEAMLELTQSRPRTRTIAFSGYDDAETIASAKAAGAVATVSKNDDPFSLLAVIRDVVDKRDA